MRGEFCSFRYKHAIFVSAVFPWNELSLFVADYQFQPHHLEKRSHGVSGGSGWANSNLRKPQGGHHHRTIKSKALCGRAPALSGESLRLLACSLSQCGGMLVSSQSWVGKRAWKGEIVDCTKHGAGKDGKGLFKRLGRCAPKSSQWTGLQAGGAKLATAFGSSFEEWKKQRGALWAFATSTPIQGCRNWQVQRGVAKTKDRLEQSAGTPSSFHVRASSHVWGTTREVEGRVAFEGAGPTNSPHQPCQTGGAQHQCSLWGLWRETTVGSCNGTRSKTYQDGGPIGVWKRPVA